LLEWIPRINPSVGLIHLARVVSLWSRKIPWVWRPATIWAQQPPLDMPVNRRPRTLSQKMLGIRIEFVVWPHLLFSNILSGYSQSPPLSTPVVVASAPDSSMLLRLLCSPDYNLTPVPLCNSVCPKTIYSAKIKSLGSFLNSWNTRSHSQHRQQHSRKCIGHWGFFSV